MPDALTEPARFGQTVVSLVAEERADLVIPVSEPAMLALLPLRTALSPAVLPFPDTDTFAALADKEQVLAEEHERVTALRALAAAAM